MKKIALLLILLVRASLFLHAMPMEEKWREGSQQLSRFSDQQERLRGSPANGAGGGELQRVHLQGLSIAEESDDPLIAQQEEEVATQHDSAGEVANRANLATTAAENFSRRASEYRIQGAKANQERRSIEGRNNAFSSLSFSVLSEGKAIAAEQMGNEPLAARWREGRSLYEKSVEAQIKVAPYNQRSNDSWSWNNALSSLSFSVVSEEKAIAAEQRGNELLFTRWREAKSLYDKSIEAHIKAASYEGSEGEGWIWNNAGNAFADAAASQVKSIEEEQNGNEALAAKWREIAALYKRSIDPFAKAIKAYEQRNTAEGITLNNAGLAFYWSAISQTEAMKAEEGGNEALALKWHEVRALYEKSIEAFTQAAEAYKERNRNKGQGWNNAGLAFQSAAWAREKDDLRAVAHETDKANEAIRRAQCFVAQPTAGANGAAEPDFKK